METKEVIAKVRKLEISTRGLVEGLLAGAYHSVFQGQGIEFHEVREYRYGDDIRAIDWNVTARAGKPFIKEFIEERDLTAYIVLDVSASGDFGTEMPKMQQAIELAASLMFAAARNNDRIGLGLFTKDIELFMAARKGKRHVLRLISDMISYKPKYRETDIANSLASLSKILRKRCIIFVISDFFSADGFIRPLQILRKRHDVIAIGTTDAREYMIPDVGYIELEDEETGEQLLVDTSDEDFRRNYTALMSRKQEELEAGMRIAKTDLINIQTEVSFEIPLRRFFKDRKRRREHR